ncbi:MAG: UDP-N-acetylmuramate dehydrogenase [Oscillospiraceae bacterium]|nr:UDP-N-acetylmuramate dehydrogenase [Oscillospiraceae bacterium]
MDYNSILKFSSDKVIKYLINEPLSKHTTFKIGGSADVFLNIKNINELKKVTALLKKESLPYFIIGNGSNLLVSDDGYRGIIIKLENEFDKIFVNDEVFLCCGSAVKLSNACIKAMELGLSGLEFAYGIPGTCGGAVFMNAGAYGGEISESVFESSHIDNNGEIGVFKQKDLMFSYRKSIYSQNKFTITYIKFRLSKGNKIEIKRKMDDLMQRRNCKQPLNMPSAGSIFKRPEGYYAGTLIEQCGLKGKTIGGAVVSEKHCGFIINKGNATCSDVIKLIEFIKFEVLRQKGVKLEEEIKILK